MEFSNMTVDYGAFTQALIYFIGEPQNMISYIVLNIGGIAILLFLFACIMKLMFSIGRW